MNGKQRAVMWIGLILVAANLVMKWSSIRSIIFSGASIAGGGGGGGSASSDPTGGITVNPPGQGVTVPFGGFPLPVPFLSSQSATPSNTLV